MYVRVVFAVLAAFTIVCSANSADLPPPTPEQFQIYLHKEVDRGSEAAIAPFIPGETTKKLAHAMLDGMWSENAYRENMAAWLNNNRNVAMPDLLVSWVQHYHKAFSGIFEFLDDDTVSVMWRLSRFNSIYPMNRADCQSKTIAQIGDFIQSANQQLLIDNWQKLSITLPKALGREFARENSPTKGDRPIPEFMVKIALASLRATEKSWPSEDAKRIEDQFSYGKKNWSPQESCEVSWVVSHAVNDSKVQGELVSATLMRSYLSQSGYNSYFQSMDAKVSKVQAVQSDHNAGFVNDCKFNYPRGPFSRNEQGKVTVEVLVGPDDKLISSQLVNSSGYAGLDQAVLDGLSGCKYKAAQKDGKPVKDTFKFVYNWIIPD